MPDIVLTVLDGLIVYYLIYRILLIIRGTRAVPMLVSLTAIALLYAVSRKSYLNLPTFNWLLEQFIASLFLIVVILFQADIRRALAAVGRAPLLSSTFRSGADSQVIDELVKAAQSLAQQKIGALVVVEREADLSAYIEESLRLDARLTKELLYSIFVPERQNPLHDGAVVLRHGRIESAGVFLPMSVNPSIARTLGTRHRAALGLSEETDAVVLVVSEERGTVSLAFENSLDLDLNSSDLRERLTELLIKRPTRLFRRERSDEAPVPVRSGPASKDKAQSSDRGPG